MKVVRIARLLNYKSRYAYYIFNGLNKRNLKIMKLAIVALPIVFAIIWMLFIGLNINKLNKKINY